MRTHTTGVNSHIYILSEITNNDVALRELRHTAIGSTHQVSLIFKSLRYECRFSMIYASDYSRDGLLALLALFV